MGQPFIWGICRQFFITIIFNKKKSYHFQANFGSIKPLPRLPPKKPSAPTGDEDSPEEEEPDGKKTKKVGFRLRFHLKYREMIFWPNTG